MCFLPPSQHQVMELAPFRNGSLWEIEQSELPLRKDWKDLVKTLNNGIAQIRPFHFSRTTYEYFSG